jgi:hypothetical protein
MELDALALAVDDRVESMAASDEPARLFGVRQDAADVVLVLLWSGAGRELPPTLRPPAGLCAIALETSGWAAPLDEGRPSLHPLRRRIHQTVLVYGDGDHVSVLRYEDGQPHVLRGAIGFVLDLLVACWKRRHRR